MQDAACAGAIGPRRSIVKAATARAKVESMRFIASSSSVAAGTCAWQFGMNACRISGRPAMPPSSGVSTHWSWLQQRRFKDAREQQRYNYDKFAPSKEGGMALERDRFRWKHIPN